MLEILENEQFSIENLYFKREGNNDGWMDFQYKVYNAEQSKSIKLSTNKLCNNNLLNVLKCKLQLW